MHLMVSVLNHELLACGALLILSSHIAPTAPTARLGTIQPLTLFILTLHPAGIKVGTEIPST
jgi:hypothetical protein